MTTVSQFITDTVWLLDCDVSDVSVTEDIDEKRVEVTISKSAMTESPFSEDEVLDRLSQRVRLAEVSLTIESQDD